MQFDLTSKHSGVFGEVEIKYYPRLQKVEISLTDFDEPAKEIPGEFEDSYYIARLLNPNPDYASFGNWNAQSSSRHKALKELYKEIAERIALNETSEFDLN